MVGLQTVSIGILLAAGALAGCVGDGLSPARPLLADAEAEAAAWQADAVLLYVGAYEARNGTQMAEQARAEGTGESDEAEIQLVGHDDPRPGDGRAPAWGFAFGSRAANRTYLAVFDAGGALLWAKEEEGSPRGRLAVEEWVVDSDEAWRIAAGGNATMREVLAADGVVTASVLAPFVPAVTPHPVWFLMAEAGAKRDAFLFVDAANGTILDFDEYLRSILLGNIVFQEYGQESGFLLAVRPEAREEIAVDSPYHAKLAVALGAGPETPPGQVLHLILTDSSGAVVLRLNHTRDVSVEDVQDHAVIELDGKEQAYEATITLGPGAAGLAAEYRLSWCTDGLPLPVPFDPPAACSFVQ